MRIVLIGAGNLATNIGLALKESGCDIIEVWSRTDDSARSLAEKLNCAFTSELNNISTDADAYIISIKDQALENVVSVLQDILPHEALVMHTAGSMPMNVLPFKRKAVLYPMQTFSKERVVDFKEIPIFVEASSMDDMHMLKSLASQISNNVMEMNSDDRKFIHLAAVFACNFSNHCYDIASEILSKRGISFDIMLPLIDETTRKIHTIAPHDAQTGPAVRYDKNVIDKHISLLSNMDKEIYELMSKSIYNRR